MDIKFNTQIVDISVALNALKFYKAGQYKQAIESLLKILDTEPNNWDGRLMLAASYYKTAQYGASERAFELLKERCPDELVRKQAEVGLRASNNRLNNVSEAFDDQDTSSSIVDGAQPPMEDLPTRAPSKVSRAMDSDQYRFWAFLAGDDTV